jgi:hypothetical protein
MTASSTVKSALKTSLRALVNHFNIFATDLPSGQIRREMEADGWEFGRLRHPFRATASVEYATTPEGRPALGLKASPQDRALLKNTILLKKGQLAP